MSDTLLHGCAEHISEPHKDCPYCKAVNKVRTNDQPSFRFTTPPITSIHFDTLEDAVRALFKAQGVELTIDNQCHGDATDEPVSLCEAAGRRNGTISKIHQYDAEQCCNRIDYLERQLEEALRQRDECERQYQGKVSEMLLVVSQRDDATQLLSAMCFHHRRLLGLDGAFDEVLTNAATFLESQKGGSNE